MDDAPHNALTPRQIEALRQLDAELGPDPFAGEPSVIAAPSPETSRLVISRMGLVAVAVVVLIVGLQASPFLAVVGAGAAMWAGRELVAALVHQRREIGGTPR